MPPGCGQCQLHAHAAGARPHIPQSIGRLHGQLGQRRRPHLLLGHGHLSPVEGFIREAGHPPGRLRKMLHKQNAQACKLLLRKLLRRAEQDLLLRPAQLFAHQHMGIAQPGSSQSAAEGGRRFCPAGQEKHRLSPGCQALGHRVAGTAVGRDQLPLLPGAAHRSGQQLNAGKPRQHPAGDAKGPQHRQQLGRTGVKPGVAAVHKGSIHLRVSRQRGKDILRLIQGLPVIRAALRQLFQQALCPQDQSGVLQGGKALRGQAFRRARPHPDECDHCSISLQCVRICSAVSPCSAGRRMTMS